MGNGASGEQSNVSVQPGDGISTIAAEITEHVETQNALLDSQAEIIGAMARRMIDALKEGKKILIMGNGGSAADAQHMAGELVGRFKLERRALSAIALTTDTSVLTSVANDYGVEDVFARQVEGLANPGDVVVGITTSGNSRNVLKAVAAARQKGALTVGLTGREGGRLAEAVDLCLRVPSDDTPRIQESHGLVIHILCLLIERALADR